MVIELSSLSKSVGSVELVSVGSVVGCVTWLDLSVVLSVVFCVDLVEQAEIIAEVIIKAVISFLFFIIVYWVSLHFYYSQLF